MTLLVVLIILIVLAIVLVARQAWRVDAAAPPAGAAEIAASFDRLSELERSAAAGVIGGEEAQAARNAIKARILAAADRGPRAASPGFSPRARQLAGLVVAGLLIGGLAGLYQWYDGETDWFDRVAPPSASSASAMPAGPAAVEALAEAEASQAPSRSLAMAPQSGQQGALPAGTQRPPQSPIASVDEMIDRLVKRLDRNPSDVEGWRMLGWSYFYTDRYGPSVAAYAKAVALGPDNADLRSAYGEALVRRADGRVTDEAKAAFTTALQLDPKDARARFFMGLAKDQSGDQRAAFDDWMAILNEMDSKEPWFADMQQRVAALGQELGVDVAPRLRRGTLVPGAEGTAPRPAASERAPAPTAADIRDAEAMSGDDRDAMIRGMVERLAARLDQSPNDVEGWSRLIRSREVLGDDDEARRALQRALAVFKSAPQDEAKIVAVARELGLMQ
jgi:cytochrome c-type biogenesis protein CcmH